MQIETTVKNYVLEVLLQMTQSENFNDIYNQLLDNYKTFTTNGKEFSNSKKKKEAVDNYKKQLKKRLDLRENIYRIQAREYGKDIEIACHYLQKDINLPIWAIFELMTFGEFGTFVSCLNKRCRAKISINLGIYQGDDTNSMMPQRLIFATKDLRNVIAHNNVVFDTRFKKGEIHKQVSNAISNATDINNISFDTITDYLILIIYQLKLLKFSKTELKRIISEFENAVEKLRNSIPINYFNQIIYTDNNNKIKKLKKYISS